ncbi:hypothetical protein GCM10007938_25720 [Vibrio zhanjiangensis]|uniref:SH3b domain-containing protein n=1 Tax=Vibrio zhanjiangensis TaxID=1046128 RepID=A0ABQ6F1I4_9VIBR|nr:hypothetical protein [Vibrio zhanjiangensis]GLT18791.1 hypothetical protein GCM10007938_25720 [Vibrio zhanjiangensis]
MKLITFASALLYSGFLYAEVKLDRDAVSLNAVGIIVSPSPIRSAPPHGLFNLFVGKEIESTVLNEQVKIIGKKTYGGFSGTNVWYQVESVNDLETSDIGPLWIYGGVEGKSDSIQVIIKEIVGTDNGH